MPGLLRLGAGVILVILIMFIGSLVLWVGTPLLCLWVGSWVQGATGSLTAAVGAMVAAMAGSVAMLATTLAKLSEVHRAIYLAQSLEDPGHAVLERVLVIGAAFALATFGLWFLFFAGASPVPIGIQI